MRHPDIIEGIFDTSWQTITRPRMMSTTTRPSKNHVTCRVALFSPTTRPAETGRFSDQNARASERSANLNQPVRKPAQARLYDSNHQSSLNRQGFAFCPQIQLTIGEGTS